MELHNSPPEVPQSLKAARAQNLELSPLNVHLQDEVTGRASPALPYPRIQCQSVRTVCSGQPLSLESLQVR